MDTFDCTTVPDEGYDEQIYRDFECAREIAAGVRAASDHFKACQSLHINYDGVTPEDLRRATLSGDVYIQVSRLKPLFEACGLVGDGYRIERGDVVSTLAAFCPQDEAERRLLYQSTAAFAMSMNCSSLAMSAGTLPHVAALHIGNFHKLSSLGMNLQDKLLSLRAQRGTMPIEVHGHVHLHAGPALPKSLGGQVSLGAEASPADGRSK